MDLICPVCAEPVDNDSLHDEVEDRRSMGQFDVTYHNVLRDFQSRGCEALGFTHAEGRGSLKAMAASAMYELMGDDADGAAAMMEDFEYLGFL